jgi:hypothetical protein
MLAFVVLYRGASVSDAEMVALSAAPDLVDLVASHLLKTPEIAADPVLTSLHEGRQAALRLIKTEAAHDPE